MTYRKYKNIKVMIDGFLFDSKGEGNRYLYLKDCQKKGKIFDLKCQVKFELQEAFEKNGKKYRNICYYADFTYHKLPININQHPDHNLPIIEDFKGKKTDVYKIKKKLFEYKYGHLTIREIKNPGEDI